MLYGRSVERSVVDRLLAGARAGRSGVLVVRGDPGIGKTALLDYAAAAAGPTASGDGGPGGAMPGGGAPPGRAGMGVLRSAGVESEAELSFSGLHLLLGPALDRRFALPQPQRDALSGAFGLQRTESCDRFLVGLAVLSLLAELAELAEDGPLLCLVDDAHWLDRSSAEALVFAARRLDAEGIAVIFAASDHNAPFPAPGLPVLRLGGLDAASAAALLSEHGAGLPAGARCRVLAEARGNPLGLIELCAAYHDHPPAAGPGGAGPALTGRLQQAFEGQARRLPGDTQALLLVAAAEGSGDLGVVLDAASMFGAVAADLAPAEQADLVRVAGSAVTFRHPLVRAAVYQGAVLGRRLAVHRALAGALRNPADADRRAWHLAAAATGPDEGVAAELERTAAKARARSGYAAAAAAYERAVQLTTDPAAQADRLIAGRRGRGPDRRVRPCAQPGRPRNEADHRPGRPDHAVRCQCAGRLRSGQAGSSPPAAGRRGGPDWRPGTAAGHPDADERSAYRLVPRRPGTDGRYRRPAEDAGRIRRRTAHPARPADAALSRAGGRPARRRSRPAQRTGGNRAALPRRPPR
jgi:hypothetical protein